MALANFIFMGWETIVCEMKTEKLILRMSMYSKPKQQTTMRLSAQINLFFNAKKLTWLKMLVRAMEIEPLVRIKFVSFWRHLYNIYVMISSTKIILALTFFHVAIEQKVLPNNLITVLTLWVRKANLQNWHQFLYWMLYFLACHTIQPIEKLHSPEWANKSWFLYSTRMRGKSKNREKGLEPGQQLSR